MSPGETLRSQGLIHCRRVASTKKPAPAKAGRDADGRYAAIVQRRLSARNSPRWIASWVPPQRTVDGSGVCLAAVADRVWVMLFFDRIEQMTRRRIVGFTCENHDWDY
jgi:hypothetical protein